MEARGALLGTLVGDALGMPFDGCRLTASGRGSRWRMRGSVDGLDQTRVARAFLYASCLNGTAAGAV
jgi:hypothetical protein